VHSLDQFCDLIESTFHHFDPEPLNKKLIQQWKAPHESPMEFWYCFRVLQFQAPKSQMKFQCLMDKFDYYLTKFVNPKRKFKPKPHSTYFGDGATQSQTNMVIVTSDCPSSPHQTAPPLQNDVGEQAHTYVQLSHPSNITSLNFHADLVAKPIGSHMHVLPQPPSWCSADPPNCIVLCSSIMDSTFIMNEDQVINRVGVAQPTCAIIHEEFDWEIEHQTSAKDDSLVSEPPPFFPNIFGDPAIHDFACASSFMDALIIDHS